MRAITLALALFAIGEGASAATPEFFARRDYPNLATYVQVADTNGDGIPDIIAGGFNVFFGNGNGTFRPGPISPAGMYSVDVFIATDLNGDGVVDLVVAGEITEGDAFGIGVSFGNGDGTFQPAVPYYAGTLAGNAGGLVMGDFNGDGIPDAVITGLVLPSGPIGIWLFPGEGGGVFGAPISIPYNGAVAGSYEIAAADFNGHGNLDLVITTGTGFSILLGNGNGTFQPPEHFNGPSLTKLAVGDLNMDGRPDVVLVAQYSPGVVYLYLNNGTGGFSGPSYANLPEYSPFTIGDVNGDGIPDLVNGYGYIAFGKGNGTFDPPVYYPTDSSLFGPYNPVVADLRNNGLNDIVVQGSQAVSVLLAEGKGKFEDGIWTPVAGAISCGAPADFTSNGKPDLAMLTTQGISILLGTGNGTKPYTTGPSIALSGAGCPLAADLTRNGIQDLLVPQQSTIFSYLGSGAGTFTQKGSAVFPAPFGDYSIGDFNNDGYPDIVTSTYYIAYGKGDGTFQSPVSFWTNPPYCLFTEAAAGDFNNDGFSDLAITCNSTNSIYILMNNKKGGFTVSSISNSEGPYGILLADLTGSGNLDMLVSSYDAPTMYVYLGNGKGGFTLKQEIPFLIGAASYAVADVNGDGKPDLLWLNSYTDSVAVFLGAGNGAFAKTPFYLGTGPAPAQVLTQNLHGQSPTAGVPDIVLPDGSGGVRVLLNETK